MYSLTWVTHHDNIISKVYQMALNIKIIWISLEPNIYLYIFPMRYDIL